MIAAQLLAYYFTELKDDQLKKVGEGATAALRRRAGQLCKVAAAGTPEPRGLGWEGGTSPGCSAGGRP